MMKYVDVDAPTQVALDLLRLRKSSTFPFRSCCEKPEKNHTSQSQKSDEYIPVSGQFDDAEEDHGGQFEDAEESVPSLVSSGSHQTALTSLASPRLTAAAHTKSPWKPQAFTSSHTLTSVLRPSATRAFAVPTQLANCQNHLILRDDPPTSKSLPTVVLKRRKSRTITPPASVAILPRLPVLVKNKRKLPLSSHTKHAAVPLKPKEKVAGKKPGIHATLQTRHPDPRIVPNCKGIVKYQVVNPVAEMCVQGEPNLNDILLGRGAGIASHAGNVRFREEILAAYRPIYCCLPKFDKLQLSCNILNFLRLQGCRFLVKLNNSWKEVGDIKARAKISQCLREKGSTSPADLNKALLNLKSNCAVLCSTVGHKAVCPSAGFDSAGHYESAQKRQKLS